MKLERSVLADLAGIVIYGGRSSIDVYLHVCNDLDMSLVKFISTFAMLGALAWQVNSNPNKKKFFCLERRSYGDFFYIPGVSFSMVFVSLRFILFLLHSNHGIVSHRLKQLPRSIESSRGIY
ncbi:hypothetical protein ZOSMA_35G00680 [Zostera marina]|uniref:Uncharacterized protein n=1 Tax=Zostera marina TaxID=29655 RepID=A0A0K9P6I0_ZOSMR|nr:hypothetical protein ZOSMA_35G00680 [Zostera marina]